MGVTSLYSFWSVWCKPT